MRAWIFWKNSAWKWCGTQNRDMSEENKKKWIYLPILLALVFSLGMVLGERLRFYDRAEFSLPISIPLQFSSKSKVDEVLNYIEDQYVDTISKKILEEKTIIALLQNLDPHSSYISPEDLKATNEPLNGSFDGIGIEFSIIKDTIRVVAALSGGPSEALGIQPGDKIVRIEGDPSVGNKITNRFVLDKLRGPGGTKVTISIQRSGSVKLTDYTITRGKIPIYSVDAAYMANKKTGYIKISRFAATTYDEYLSAFKKLRSQGMEQLILDLRGNPGGLLNSAVNFADEFLEKGKEIVYTEGRSQPKRIFTASEEGLFEKEKLIILIDEGSASASEIIAGAVQDNDRGTIIGRRSFGKGLVQEQAELSDGSALRLTVARYFTPTGRCIQRSYSNGSEAYYSEELERYEHGELLNADSIKVIDSLKYTTPEGKIVYGGGGIMPDVFVPIDTSGRSAFLTEVIYTGLINQFAFDYVDKHRKELNAFRNFENFNSGFNVTDALLDDFISFAKQNLPDEIPGRQGSKIKRNQKEDIKSSEKILKTQLKANIARNIWHSDGFYRIIHTIDNTFKKALELSN